MGIIQNLDWTHAATAIVASVLTLFLVVILTLCADKVLP